MSRVGRKKQTLIHITKRLYWLSLKLRGSYLFYNTWLANSQQKIIKCLLQIQDDDSSSLEIGFQTGQVCANSIFVNTRSLKEPRKQIHWVTCPPITLQKLKHVFLHTLLPQQILFHKFLHYLSHGWACFDPQASLFMPSSCQGIKVKSGKHSTRTLSLVQNPGEIPKKNLQTKVHLVQN